MADEVEGGWDRAAVRRLLEGLLDPSDEQIEESLRFEDVTDLDVSERDRAYEEAIRRAARSALRHRRRSRTELSQRETALRGLKQAGRTRGSVAARPPGRFGAWALCHAYLEMSFESRYRDPEAMLAFAFEAVDVSLDAIPESYPPGVVFDLRARAYAELANAQRVCNNVAAADALVNRARQWCSQGSGDLVLYARVLDIEASLRIEQRRLEEADLLLQQVYDLHQELGDPHLAGRSLFTRGHVAYTAGASKEVPVGFLNRSLTLLDRSRDPQLVDTVYHTMILYLAEYGDYQRAAELLLESGLGKAFEDQPLNYLRLRWVEGMIQAGLGQLDRADATFQELRGAFRERGLDYDAALVGLDLAAVWVRQGRVAQVADLSVEMRDTFLRLSISREAAVALAFLTGACEAQMVSLAMVARTRSFLVELRANPKLVFDPISLETES